MDPTVMTFWKNVRISEGGAERVYSSWVIGSGPDWQGAHYEMYDQAKAFNTALQAHLKEQP